MQSRKSPGNALEPAVVEIVWEKLLLAYGHRFLGNWDGMKIAAVKADWGIELACFKGKPEAIAYGLRNLPATYPPNVFEFRAICGRRPDEPAQQALPDMAKKAAPQELEQTIARLLAEPPPSSEPRKVQWARRYISDFGQPGRKLTQVRREFLAEARRIVARYDHPPNNDEELKKLKAEVQAKVDAAQGAAS